MISPSRPPSMLARGLPNEVAAVSDSSSTLAARSAVRAGASGVSSRARPPRRYFTGMRSLMPSKMRSILLTKSLAGLFSTKSSAPRSSAMARSESG
jgi:hypothetical protein